MRRTLGSHQVGTSREWHELDPSRFQGRELELVFRYCADLVGNRLQHHAALDHLFCLLLTPIICMHF